MRKMHFLLLTLFCFGGFVFAATPTTLGFDPFEDVKKSCDTTAKESSVCDENNGKDPLTGKDGIITKVARIISIVTGLAAVIVIIISGLQYITSGGNPEKAASAKNILTYAVIGLLVAVLAQALVVLVLSKL